ncbi:MAG: hypothetical protein HY720_10875 [Planctomycetes bacterium]|nr:hypothetical protein [Planctomycetota bacterium]
MSTNHAAGLAIALAWILAGAGAIAQTTEERVDGLIKSSLPADRPVAFEYAISTNLDGLNQLTLNANGVFEGRDRLAFDLHASTWIRERGAHFVIKDASVAHKEDLTEEEPDAEMVWHLFQKMKEAERDPAYASLLMPAVFLSQVGSYSSEFREGGKRGIGAFTCQGFSGEIEPRRARSLLADFGLVLDDGDAIENVVGLVTIWTGEDDGLLRSIEFHLQARVKMKGTEAGNEEAVPGIGGGGFSWEEGTDQGPGALRRPISGSGPAGGGGSMGGEEAVRRTPERAFEISLSFDHALEEGARPAAIEPDPEAAKLVGW